MPTLKVKIKNKERIMGAFRKAPFLMMKELNIATKKTVIAISRQSRKNTPVDTGILRASHYEAFAHLQGEVGTNTDYDMFVHEGTRFITGRPYLRKAIEQKQADIDRFFVDAVENVNRNIMRSA